VQIEEAKKRIEELNRYIEMVESYHPTSYEQNVFKLYVLMESVNKVAEELNKLGYKVGNRKVIGKDVSDLIRTKPTDGMHTLARKLFTGNKKRAQGRGWI
jgi:tetrahydromethanopterin S-methyltransferase subunit G